MSNQYLCANHYHLLCQDLNKAQQYWDRSMAMGLEAVNTDDHQKAERCFGSAYDIANIILDRQLNNCDDAKIAANTLLAAQYLATSLVQLDRDDQAESVLQQLHEKFSFICRNPNAKQTLRETLCNCLIPYIEKLYCITLTTHRTLQAAETLPNDKFGKIDHLFNLSKSCYYQNTSTLLH